MSTIELRNPAHTGENRCLPCTVVNLGIAAVLAGAAAAVAVALVASVVLAATLGVAVFTACALVVYLRGYLVPGTPQLTRRYLPPAVLDWFGKAPRDGWVADSDAATAVESGDGRFADAGPTDSGPPANGHASAPADSDAGLATAGVESALSELEAATDPTPADVAGLLGRDPDDVRLVSDRSVSAEGRRRRAWPSALALATDVAAAAALCDRTPGWAELGVDARLDALQGIRFGLDRCPASGCDGAVAQETERLEDCCRRPRLLTRRRCRSCDAVLAERVLASLPPTTRERRS